MRKKIQNITFLMPILLLTFVCILPKTIKADINPDPSPPGGTPSGPVIGIDNPFAGRIDNPEQAIRTAAVFLRNVGVFVAVFGFLFLGFKFIKSQGKPEEISATIKWFWAMCVATVIILAAPLLVDMFQDLSGQLVAV